MDAQDNSSAQFISLDNQIKTLIEQIENLKTELKKQKEMVEDSFENDAIYNEHNQKVKDALKVRSATKLQITKQGDISEKVEKIAEDRDEIKRMEATLSELVVQYQKETGATQIETNNGEVLLIVNKVKLVKAKSFETS